MRLRCAVPVGAVLAACAALIGCSMNAESTDVSTCVDQPFRAELHVDARDPRRVWATDATGRDVAIRPRAPGAFAFDLNRPALLLDAAGGVVSFSGEITQSGCLDALSGTLYIGPGDVPDPDRPPN